MIRPTIKNMGKESTISYKVYPNERLKPVSFHGIDTHPLYIQVIYDRKPIYFKSYFFDLLSKEKYSLDYIAGKKAPGQKEIIAKEQAVLAFLIRQQNKNFSLDSFQDNYYYYSKDLLSLMDDRFKDYLITFFEDQGLPGFRSLIEAGRETIMSAGLIDGFRSALKPQLFKILLENAPYYGPPYLPSNDFIQQKSKDIFPTFSIYQWEEYKSEFEMFLKKEYSDYSFKEVEGYIKKLIKN